MLSYQHGYHAGNHADVLKHIVLLAVIEYMQQKPTPIHFIDTHAGAGLYALNKEQAQTTQEARTGVYTVFDYYNDYINHNNNQSKKQEPPKLIQRYLTAVEQFNPTGQLLYYPGSPLLMLSALRTDDFIEDTLRVFERHPAERQLLEAHLIKNTPKAPTPVQGQRISRVRPVLIQGDEGFAGLSLLLPPTHRRALVLIDPSYELKTDYRSVLETLREAVQKFPTGTYIVWYPLLKRIEAQQLIPRLKSLCTQGTPLKGIKTTALPYLNTTLAVSSPRPDGFGGLWGSGMFVINPPWTLASELKTTLPHLTQLLSQGEPGHRWTVEEG